VWHEGNQVVFYSGHLVDLTGTLAAHDAEALARHWERLPQSLEGHFAAVRLGGTPATIELLIDPLGMEQVYYYRQGSMWLVSNSVRLLRSIGARDTLDALGLCLFLVLGRLVGDRTLHEDIRVFDGGRLLSWQPGRTEPEIRPHFERTELLRIRQTAFSAEDARQFADQFIGMMGGLAREYGELQCPITGGRDSRLR
jgi:asparagine synthase (glutamine-hydrolysing)